MGVRDSRLGRSSAQALPRLPGGHLTAPCTWLHFSTALAFSIPVQPARFLLQAARAGSGAGRMRFLCLHDVEAPRPAADIWQGAGSRASPRGHRAPLGLDQDTAPWLHGAGRGRDGPCAPVVGCRGAGSSLSPAPRPFRVPPAEGASCASAVPLGTTRDNSSTGSGVGAWCPSGMGEKQVGPTQGSGTGSPARPPAWAGTRQLLRSPPPLLSSAPSVAVIRAKAVSAKEVDSGNDIYGNPIKRIQYEVKQIKVRGTVPGPGAGRERQRGAAHACALSPDV